MSYTKYIIYSYNVGKYLFDFILIFKLDNNVDVNVLLYCNK